MRLSRKSAQHMNNYARILKGSEHIYNKHGNFCESNQALPRAKIHMEDL